MVKRITGENLMADLTSAIWKWDWHSSYYSQPPQPAVVYFFQAGVLFSSVNAKGTGFIEVYSENIYMFINTNPHTFPSHVTNSPSQCRTRKHQVRQPKQQVRQQKQQVCPISIYAVLWRCNFCCKFTHFSGVEFTGQKMKGRTKMTNMRYDNGFFNVIQLHKKTHYCSWQQRHQWWRFWTKILMVRTWEVPWLKTSIFVKSCLSKLYLHLMRVCGVLE